MPKVTKAANPNQAPVVTVEQVLREAIRVDLSRSEGLIWLLCVLNEKWPRGNFELRSALLGNIYGKSSANLSIHWDYWDEENLCLQSESVLLMGPEEKDLY